MKKKLDESISRKISTSKDREKQKVGPGIVKWLKENPGFEQAVSGKLGNRHRLEVKRGPKIGN